uniref:Threonine/homoserine efflux transporter RhtA n=1 Tax=Candidatus Kentrum sp. FM TaxID=2126340 RepID=A0A450T502_9GAMM|nr:MAG: Threonine/homoserine efflux transporter RhtA [Candidatus Kentron sp. FM]VFJ61764.1 MAG: Threonine/homoserine efflux transporter RhtA [Candidatus Kentron sp. FM]VFK13555.1 MAG: Threonine/homoserine efflux transporter RhtA [Candidatus Kentron sp. FM]
MRPAIPGKRFGANPEPDTAGAPHVPQWAVYGALLFVQVSIGSLHVEAKLVMGPDYGVSPFALAMLRIAGSAAVLVPLALAMGRLRLPSLRDFGILTILAVLGVVSNQAFYLAGLNITSPISATLLVAMIPVFTVLIVAVTGRARPASRELVGIAIAVFGIAVLVDFALPRLGDTLVLLNAAVFALYVVYSKDILQRLGALTVMAWVFGISTVLFLPIGLRDVVVESPNWSGGAIGLVVYIVLVPTVFFYAANAWALRHATPGQVTVFMFLQPVITALLAWIQLGQTLSLQTLYAAILTMTGVGLVLSAKQQARK